MSSTGTTISRSSSFGLLASTIVHFALRPDQELADPLEGPLRGREPDPLDRVVAGVLRELVEPLQGQRHVGAPLRRGDGVDLVHDQGLDAGQDLARARADHQVERLGRRDQDVGRGLPHRPALGLGRVARAQADRDRRADARERGAQVPLDVVAQRLERRDVDDLDPGRRAPRGAWRGCRSPTGTPKASFPSPSGRRSACARRSRSPASRPPGQAWAPRKSSRTTS